MQCSRLRAEAGPAGTCSRCGATWFIVDAIRDMKGTGQGEERAGALLVFSRHDGVEDICIGAPGAKDSSLTLFRKILERGHLACGVVARS